MDLPFTSLRGQFLVSVPQMEDPNFERSVVLVCEHSEKGAMGIVINRELGLGLAEVLDQFGLPTDAVDLPIFEGGPVQMERGFVLHDSKYAYESTMMITDDLHLTTSKDVIESIAMEDGPERVLVALGYAGWSAGQLEQELDQCAWLNCPSDLSIIFDSQPSEKLDKTLALMGINLSQISGQVGHA